MKVRLTTFLLGLFLFVPTICQAEDASFEINSHALNNLVDSLGGISDSGFHQPGISISQPGIKLCPATMFFLDCPGLPGDSGFKFERIPLIICETVGGGVVILPTGEKVPWQWWINEAFFTLKSGSMTFTAKVRTQIGDNLNFTTRTVPASIDFNDANDQLVINVAEFKVPLIYRDKTAATVDVAGLYTLSIPIEPQTFKIPSLQAGSTKTVIARVIDITTVQYLDGKILVGFNMGF